MNEKGIFFFLFNDKGGCDQAIESGPLMVRGRLIADNILMAHELVTGYNKDSGPSCCVFKIDIRKAYDTVNGTFLSLCWRVLVFIWLLSNGLRRC